MSLQMTGLTREMIDAVWNPSRKRQPTGASEPSRRQRPVSHDPQSRPIRKSSSLKPQSFSP